MTEVNENSFDGPNLGAEYEPLSLIKSAPMNDDMSKIKADLDYHLAVLQAIYIKLDSIESGSTADQTPEEIVNAINASAAVIDSNNLALEVVIATELANAISAHLNASTAATRHALNTINGTITPYSTTPTTLVTSSDRTLLDEVNNIRFQINRIIGKSTWASAPSKTMEVMSDTLNTLSQGKLRLTVVKKTSSYSPNTVGDYAIMCDATAANITIYLPDLNNVSATHGIIYQIKKIDATAHEVVVRAYSGQYVDDDQDYILYSANEALTIIADTTSTVRRWRII